MFVGDISIKSQFAASPLENLAVYDFAVPLYDDRRFGSITYRNTSAGDLFTVHVQCKRSVIADLYVFGQFFV